MLVEKSRFYDFTISYDVFQMKSYSHRDKYDLEWRDAELLYEVQREARVFLYLVTYRLFLQKKKTAQMHLG